MQTLFGVEGDTYNWLAISVVWLQWIKNVLKVFNEIFAQHMRDRFTPIMLFRWYNNLQDVLKVDIIYLQNNSWWF